MLDTSAAQPTVTALRQKQGARRTAFHFSDEHLEFEYKDATGCISRKVPWHAVSPRPRIKHGAHSALLFPKLMFLALALTTFQILTRPEAAAVAAFVILPTAFALICGVTLLYRRYWRPRYSLVPTPEIEIVVLEGKCHDEILDKIYSFRQSFFQQFASTDPAISIRDNLRRLRWLVDNDVVSPERFLEQQRKLLPSVPQSLLKEKFRFSPACYSQRYLEVACQFDMKPTHLEYSFRDFFGAERTMHVGYEELPSETEFDESVCHAVWPAMLAGWLCVLAIVAISHISSLRPPSYYVGWHGLIRAAIEFGPIALILVGAGYVATLMSKLRCSYIHPEMAILRDKKYEAILHELMKRRTAALRYLAEPDPLLTDDEQANLLKALKTAGIISEAEHRAYRTKAESLRRFVELDALAEHATVDTSQPTYH